MAHPTDILSGLTRALLAEVLDYDPATGHFTWKVARSTNCKVGQRAGSVNKASGYREIWIGERAYQSARLACLWMDGEWPAACVDHINLDRTDDRWANLRHATAKQNCANRGLNSRNKSGFKGVSAVGDKWCASIKLNGKSKNLGLYNTKEEAANTYLKALTEARGEYARSTLGE